MATELKAGELIHFGLEHVASIWADQSVGFPNEKRAWANRRIVEEDIQPKVLIYEAPENSEESGWTLLLGSETEAEMNDAGRFIASNLGWLVERCPAMLPTVKAAVVGTADGRSDLQFVRGWPGSTFQLTVVDPQGKVLAQLASGSRR